MKRVGIYSGSFNPVHAGHIAFALQSVKGANLDKIFFMPERYRPNKTDIAHFGHRVAMIRQAIRPYNNFALIENSDVSFSIEKTLPKLRNQFFGSRLVFLMGSDNFENLKNWPKVETLLKHSELVVGIRAGDELMIEQ